MLDMDKPADLAVPPVNSVWPLSTLPVICDCHQAPKQYSIPVCGKARNLCSRAVYLSDPQSRCVMLLLGSTCHG